MAANNPNDGSLPPISDFPTDPANDISAALEAPPEIPGYQILGPLGRGGMGVVFRALDVQLKREVAIKLVGPHVATAPTALARFRREAEAVARLQHPNIIQIFSYGAARTIGGDSVPYLVLELAVHGTLAESIAGSPQNPAGATGVVAVLARAVQYAHERGIIHRDLKPQNVLLAPDPKIADFGLARLLSDEDSLTVEHARPGTPCNMSPEQISGEYPIGPATDIYALGTILFELLTGRPPFKADSRSVTLHLVQHEQPPPPSRFAAGISRDLDAICLKCLAKDPRSRYASARDLAYDLEASLALRPTMARPRTWLQRTGLALRRRPVISGLLACTLLALGAWLSSLQRYSVDTTHLRIESAAAAQKAEAAAAAAALAERQNESRRRAGVYVEQLRAAHNAWTNRDVMRSRRYLAEVDSQLRGWEWHYLNRLTHDQLLDIDAQADAIFFSQDGHSLITQSLDEFNAWSAADGTRQAHWRLSDAFPTDSNDSAVKLHGRVVYQGADCLLLSNGDEWRCIRAVTMQPEHTWAMPEARVLAWNRNQYRISPTETTPDAGAAILPIKQLIYESRPFGKFGLIDFPSGKEIELKLPTIDWATTRTWLNEHFLALVNSEGSLSLISLADGTTQFEIPGASLQIKEVFLNEDIRHFATLEGHAESLRIVVRNSSDGQPVDNEKGVWNLDPGLFSAEAFAGKNRVFSIGRRMDGPWELTYHATHEGMIGVPLGATWRGVNSLQDESPVVPRVFYDGDPADVVAVAESRGFAVVFDVDSPRKVIQTASRGQIKDMDVNPAKDRLATLSDDGAVQIWTLEREQNKSAIETPFDRWGLARGAGGTWRIALNWNELPIEDSSTSNWSPVRPRERRFQGVWGGAAGQPSGIVLEAIHHRKSTAPQNDYTFTSTLNLGSSTLVASMAPDFDSPLYATVDGAQRLVAVMVANLTDAPTIAQSAPKTETPASENPNPNSQELQVLWLDKTDGQLPAHEIRFNADAAFSAIALSTDGGLTAATTTSGRLLLIETLTGVLQKEWKLGEASVTALAIDSSGNVVAVGYKNGVVEAIRLSDGHKLLGKRAHDASVKMLKFSPSGEYLISGLGLLETNAPTSDGARRDPDPQRLIVWQPQDGRRHFEINDAVGSPQSLSFNSGETRLALAKVGGSLDVYDTTLGVRLLTFDDEHCCPAAAVSFHPRDDDLLVSASSCTRFLHVWSGASQLPVEDAAAGPDPE